MAYTNDWSDAKLLEIFKQRRLKPMDKNTWKQHVIYFLNSYQSARIDRYYMSNLTALILMLPHPFENKLLFEEYIGDPIVRNVSGIVPRSVLPEEEDKPFIDELNCSTRIENIRGDFLRHVQSVLLRGTIDDVDFREIQAVVGVMALICFRSMASCNFSCVNNPDLRDQMSLHELRHFRAVANSDLSFLKDSSRTELNRMIQKFYPNIVLRKDLPLPSDEFLNYLETNCDRSHFVESKLLTFLVGAYTLEMKKNPRDGSLIRIVYTGFLEYTRLSAMCKMQLIERISSIYNIEIGRVIRLIRSLKPPRPNLSPEMEQICRMAREILGNEMEIDVFYSKFIAAGSNVISWPWARLVEARYFGCFVFDEGDIGCINLAAVVALTDPTVWRKYTRKPVPGYLKLQASEWAIRFDTALRALQ